jgi:hypothetical protein
MAAATLKVPASLQAQCDDLDPSDHPGCRISRFLVALPPASDLLLCAKHLFVGARVVAITPAGGLKDEQSELFSPES